MGKVQTHHVKIRPLNSKGVREDIDISVHNGLRLEKRRILIVDIPVALCISTGWKGARERKTHRIEMTTLLYNASCMSSRIRSSTAGNQISYSQHP